MALLETTDGRFLTRRPAAVESMTGWAGGGMYPPMWSDGTRNRNWPDEDTDAPVLTYEGVYSEQPWVAAAVNKLARQIATLPLKTYRRVGDSERERLRDHPVDQLLRAPLPRKGPVQTKWWLIFSMLLHGNSLLAKLRPTSDDPPVGLFPLDWTEVSAFADQGSFVEWWSTTQFGDERFLPVTDSVHVAWGGTSSEIGISPIEQLGTTVRLEDAARRQQTAWFVNGVKPSVVLSPGDNLNLPLGQLKELMQYTKDQIQDNHGGPDNGSKVLMVAPGTKPYTVSMTSSDAQLVESRMVTRDEVSAVFDIPPPLLGDLRHATLANVTEYRSMLYKDVLRPWLTVIEEGLQAQLIDSEPAWAGQDIYVEFDLSEQLKGEPESLAKTIQVQIATGVMTPNEGRALMNMPPDGDADDEDNPANKLYLPVNNLQPIGTETGAVPQPVNPSDTSAATQNTAQED